MSTQTELRESIRAVLGRDEFYASFVAGKAAQIASSSLIPQATKEIWAMVDEGILEWTADRKIRVKFDV